MKYFVELTQQTFVFLVTPKARFSSQSDDNPESSISTISKDKSKNVFENVTLLVKKKKNIKS